MFKRLDSGWGVLAPCAMMPLLAPCAMMPLLALMKLSFGEWRVLMVVALLATVLMLFHQRLRHFLLLLSCIALGGGLAAVSANFSST